PRFGAMDARRRRKEEKKRENPRATATMDQLKDILKQAIKHRFWIAVGISALLPIIAYAAGSGAIKQKAIEETNAINAANTEVRKYSTGVVPNAQYKPIVDEKKEELVK